jgi:hypothetical protein
MFFGALGTGGKHIFFLLKDISTLFQGFPQISQYHNFMTEWNALHFTPQFKWLIIITFAATTIFAMVLASTNAAIQDSVGDSDKTEALFSLVQRANATVVDILSQFKAEGKPIPTSSLNQYNLSLVLAEEARSLYQEGKYSEADTKVIEALQNLKEALRIVYTTYPEQPTETEINFERAVLLKSSISRFMEQLQLVENQTRLATETGYNTTKIDAEIQTVKSLLNEALNDIDQKRFDSALDNLAEAKVLADQLLTFLRSFADNLQIQRIEIYINKTETRLETIRDNAISLSNVDSLAALDDADASLSNAKDYLEDQRVNDALSELAVSKVHEEEAVEYLKPIASSSNYTSSVSSNLAQLP